MTVASPAKIKELRDRTGIGMGKCKEALEESGGDIELAISNLRKSGMASAVKKEGRATNEGIVAFTETPNTIAIAVVNAETDFVIKNDKFQQFVKDVADEAAATAPKSLEAFLKQNYSKDHSLTIDEYRATLVQSIGENIQISKLIAIPKKKNHTYGLYSHLGGKIGCLVELEGSDKEKELACGIAMHVAAASPEFVDPDHVPADIISKEREIAKEQVKNKPENIIEKIVDGKMKAYFDEVCLSNQKYIRDDSKTIAALVEERGKATGTPLKLMSFLRWTI